MKKLKKKISGFTQAGLGLGIGTMVVSGVEAKGGISVSSLPAFSSMGGMMPVVGTTMMGGQVLRLTKGLQPKRKKRKRRKR